MMANKISVPATRAFIIRKTACSAKRPNPVAHRH
jgi:hypothetical protein